MYKTTTYIAFERRPNLFTILIGWGRVFDCIPLTGIMMNRKDPSLETGGILLIFQMIHMTNHRKIGEVFLLNKLPSGKLT